jgi:hemerythrin
MRKKTVINNALRELVHYTAVHFAVEESLMRIFDYPVYDEHKKHHEELTHQLVEFRKGLKQADFSLSADAVNFLSGWLMKHILMDDKKYGPFLLEKGLKKSWAKQTWTDKIWHFMHK